MVPPPRLTVSQWADKYRYLSPESSAKPGKYRTEFAPYQTEPMDSIHDRDSSVTVLQWGAQVGKSEILNNMIGYFIHSDPAPILMVQPTTDRVEEYSKERIAPMIRDTPVLAELVRDPRSRDSGNTVDMKRFPGGSLALVGANAPSGLASRPRRVVLLDEVDRYPASAGTEGDPCSLAIKRTESFWNAVVVLTSTPTVKRASRIEKEFEESDKRYWFVPCPRCGEKQTLKWAQVQWPKDKPEEAYYECEKCREHLTDAERRVMIKSGEWRATAPFIGKRGYHLSGLYTPFPAKKGFKNRLHQFAADFIAAKKKGPHALKMWVNTFLAETWEEEGETVEALPLYKRREDYGGAEVPKQVIMLTAGVDVQETWMEAECVGWGKGEESWGINRIRIPGMSADPATWAELDKWLTKEWARADGVKLRITVAFIDSGYDTDTVYKFCKPRQVRNVFACKGVSGFGRPIVGRFWKHKVTGNLIQPVGVDSAKELIYSRLKLEEVGTGFMHFPMAYDEEYFQQLTSERKVAKNNKGKTVYVWEKSRPRNEALDCRVYATAAFGLRNYDLTAMEARQVAKSGAGQPTQAQADAAPRSEPIEARPNPVKPGRGKLRGSSFVGSWRRW